MKPLTTGLPCLQLGLLQRQVAIKLSGGFTKKKDSRLDF